ncbi:alpha/beta-hydrolase [Whalleya microplaca]|nr:alpha/beta-hydrolase [Whalleya microplaca]
MASRLLSSQPFKGIYILLFSLSSIPYLAFLSLCYAFKRFRPLPEWSHKASLGVAMFRVYLRIVTAIRYQRAPQLTPGKAKERFALIEPPVDLFSGILTSPTVKPAPVGVLWHPIRVQPDATDLEGKKVVLVLAGGAFVLGWDPEEAGRHIADMMSRHFKATNTLYVQYRLATPENRFPAALQDTLTAYSYVLGLGVAPKDVFLSGDSSGGNLVIALLRYLETPQAKLPRPGGAMVWSPWVKITSDAGREYDHSEGSRVDLLFGPLLDWGANVYKPQGHLSHEVEPFISPLNHPFRIRTPLFIQSGASEALYPLIRDFAEEMSAVEGNKVRFHESELMPHDILLCHSVLGLKAQVGVAVDEAHEFFEHIS